MPKMVDNDETPTAIFLPTPALVLRWVAAAGDAPWFPSRHAREHAVPRDALDVPLAALRDAGLIRVRDWVKGMGQGYSVTPEGSECLKNSALLARCLAHPRGEREPEPVPTAYERGEEAREALLELRPPVAVPALIVANVFWFLVGFVIAVNAGRSGNAYLANGDVGLLQRLGAVSGYDLLRGEWWRLLTCAFVHNGVLHLLLNMYALASVGGVTESIWGLRRFVVLYVASAIGAGCLAMAIHPAAIGAGASGAFWGLMCSLLAWLWLNRQHLPPAVVARWLRQLGILFAISFAVSFAPGVSWAGHFGGGIVGFAVGSLFVVAKRLRRAGRWIALALTGLLVVSCIAGLVLQSHRSHEWIQVRVVDYIRHRNAYAKAIEPAMKPIQPGPVEALYRQTMDVVHLGARKPDLPAKARQLRDDAAGFAEFVRKQPRPVPIPEELSRKYVDYATAVGNLAEAILEILENPATDPGKLKERKRIVGERRDAFNQTEKLEFR
ncbi:MAG: rhomboid family intramembrane serine protease [Gemmataceae bacterium]|nr:rhomboid family intramembrane serine protease [Gemmataceae bacterium]